jgi:hydroxymethylpyrimidine pyrophosphatase-like HAD family hydrolase
VPPDPRPILVFSDNEGCLIPGKGLDFPLAELLELRNLLAANPSVQLTLCTGRSIPYVEAMTQLLGLTESELPCVCEGGAALYWPARDKRSRIGEPPYEALSEFPVEAFLAGVRATVDPNYYRVELGKIACVSLYPNGGWTVDRLYDEIMRAHPDAGSFCAQKSVAAVDVTQRGTSKASGLVAACRRIGVSPDEVACIGDAPNDLPMLQVAGFSACPNNAAPEVKRTVDFVAGRDATGGVVEILLHLLERRGE